MKKRGLWLDYKTGGPMPYPGIGVWLIVGGCVAGCIALWVIR